MSRMKVLAALAVVLAVGAVYAQQQSMQPGQQRATPAWNSPQAVQNLSQAADQANADLQKAVDTAISQAKGKAVGAAFTLHGPYTSGTGGSSAGQQSATGQGQNLVAHVYVVADNNQLKDVIVDAKNDKVLNVETRQMVQHPWAQMRESMGTGGSSGQSGADSGSQGQTLRERAGMSDTSFLRLDTAQKIIKYADQDNVTLQKAVDFANSQAKGARLVGIFLVLPNQANMGTGAAGQQSTSGQQETVYAKAFAVSGSQLKVMTCDVKNDKVLNTETRSTFISPWEGGRFGQSGMGGSSGQPGQSGSSGQESPSGQSGSSGAEGVQNLSGGAGSTVGTPKGIGSQ